MRKRVRVVCRLVVQIERKRPCPSDLDTFIVIISGVSFRRFSFLSVELPSRRSGCPFTAFPSRLCRQNGITILNASRHPPSPP